MRVGVGSVGVGGTQVGDADIFPDRFMLHNNASDLIKFVISGCFSMKYPNALPQSLMGTVHFLDASSIPNVIILRADSSLGKIRRLRVSLRSDMLSDSIVLVV